MKKLFTSNIILSTCILQFFIFHANVRAQCSFSVCSTTLTKTADFTVSGTESWTTSTGEGCVLFNAGVDMTVSGTLTLTAVNLKMSSTSVITVADGGTLNITTGSRIYSSGDMWPGIVVDPGGTLLVTGSTINDAYAAIYCLNNSSTLVSSITVDENSLFCNNEIAIQLNANDASKITHLIENSEFTAPSLKAPKAGQVGDYGVLLLNAYIGTAYFQVGNSDTYNTDSYNYFHDISIPIRGYSCNFNVQNCGIFNALPSTNLPTSTPINESVHSPGSIGILATSQNSNNFFRNFYAGLGTTGTIGLYNNFIEDCRFGIIADTKMSSKIYSNFIGGNVSGSYFSIHYGMKLLNGQSSHDVQENVLTDFKNCAIWMDDITSGTTTISENVIDLGDTDYALTPTGIRISEASLTNTHAATIENNSIAFMTTGILLQNLNDPLISLNEVDFEWPASGNAYGIRTNNCIDAIVTENLVTGSCNTCSSTIGIYAEDCDGYLADANYVDNCRIGVAIVSSAENGNLTCNEIHNCTYGVGLSAITVVDPVYEFGPVQNGTGIPSDNSWYTASVANREKNFGSTSVPDLDWYYRNLDPSPSPIPSYDMPTSLIDPNIITDLTNALNPILDNSYTGALCDYPYLRLSSDDIEIALGELEMQYSRWAGNENVLDNSSSYSIAWMFWWDVQSVEGLAEALSGALAEAYETVDASNIPILRTMMDSITTGAYEVAAEILNNITPVNTIEETLLHVYEIYLSNLNENNQLQLSDEARQQLLEISTLPADETSYAIHIAQAMLDTLMENEFIDEEERIVDFINDFFVYPNPATKSITLKFESIFSGIITLYNITSIKLYTTTVNEETERTIDISLLKQGLFLLEVESFTGEIKKAKFVKQ